MLGMARESPPARTWPLFATLTVLVSLGIFVAALAAIVAIEELLFGAGGPVARFYRNRGIGDLLEVISDGFAWLFP
jgi:hypothetical protein